jgi:hypothetical protein
MDTGGVSKESVINALTYFQKGIPYIIYGKKLLLSEMNKSE